MFASGVLPSCSDVLGVWIGCGLVGLFIGGPADRWVGVSVGLWVGGSVG